MIRGTTPRLEFTLPFETSLLAEAWITLSQDKEAILDKTLKDCKCEGNTLVLKLSQEETLKFEQNSRIEMQLRVRTLSGDAFASDIISDKADRILKEGVI